MATLNVYTGRWTNWAKGAHLGDQITMTTASGNVLIAFIAIFVTIVGGLVWSLVAYLVHQMRVTTVAKDAMHHQIQALLRNHFAPPDFVFKLMEVGWAWRSSPKIRTVARLLGLSTLALLVYGVFIAAGLLLSSVAKTGDVLLRSTLCGKFDLSPVQNMSVSEQNAVERAVNAWGILEIKAAHEYAKNCYSGIALQGNGTKIAQEAPASDCGFYVRSTLNYTTTYPGVCPFNSGICRGPTSDIVRFDTGFLSTEDLGRNTKAEDRLHFRRVTTCAPIVTDEFTDGFVNNSLGQVAEFNYGPFLAQPYVYPYVNANVTWVYPYVSYTAKVQAYELFLASTDMQALPLGNALFTVDPRIAPNGSSVSLYMLANRAYYPEPVLDPWFRATTFLPASDSIASGEDYYYSEEPGSVVGCFGEVYLCNPNLPQDKCLKWDDVYSYAWGGALDSIDSLQLNDHQLGLAALISRVVYSSSMWNIAYALGGTAVVAADYLGGSNALDSLAIEDNQWVIEMDMYHASSMAILQRAAFSATAGPTDPTLARFIVHEANGEWECSNQMFFSAAHLSFSVLGLGLIFGFGGFFIVLGALVTVIVPTIQRRSGRGEYRRRQWYANGVLQLQRVAFEDRDLGTWTETPNNDTETVPTTAKGETFVSYIDVPNPYQSVNPAYATDKSDFNSLITPVLPSPGSSGSGPANAANGAGISELLSKASSKWFKNDKDSSAGNLVGPISSSQDEYMSSFGNRPRRLGVDCVDQAFSSQDSYALRYLEIC